MPARILALRFRVPRRSLAVVAVCCSAALGLAATTARAQLISIKTVPLAEGDQFGFLPSANRGMGGVSIALADTLLDPFANPAMASRFGRAYVFGSPSFYSVSSDAGGGQTLPLGGMFRSGAFFGGVALAIQDLTPSRRPEVFFGPQLLTAGALDILSSQPVLNDPSPVGSQNNRYASAMIGRVFPGRLSVAASAFWSGLRMVDGVELLYPNSLGLRQSGHDLDLRLGMAKDWGAERAHTMEAVVVHRRFAMTHDVSYQSFFWDPVLGQPVSVPRREHNDDRTNTWGLHLKYDRALADSGWRIGGLVTGNLMSHPKIPNYEIVNIPRDPGRSTAYNVGLGVARSHGPTTFGLDAIFEPIWSHTWADAAAPVVTTSGKTIPTGGRTIENQFRFANAHLRTGVGHVLPLDAGRSSLQFQLGLQLHAVRYWLDQYDHVQEFGRGQQEHWMEWTRTWGASLRFATVEVHYRGFLTTGAGRPGVARNGGPVFSPASDLRGTNFLLAPSGPVTLDPVSVTAHQFTVSLPIH